ncbi:hypothetical protein FDP41_011331 [Naegleria fowleri]|uniref:Protein EFR3 n=1 Tax=Naegleria fowleri TaxID=5763 RepID=A0A6A5C5P0_NAEFO|nr:uncharacterized protein FDP41_011331 [Naegleria fowleri]KAF0982401.1 hypothetical protein FDP41_011331 [Naegleria fowleri]CAG4719139.1 unnamed protein product [Naegleria fowleri]
MGICCGSKEPSYRKRINDIYLDAIQRGETNKTLLTSLTLRAVTYPDQLPSIGSTLEARIKSDYTKGNQFNVRVGCDIFDDLIHTRSDLSYFVVNVDNVIALLIDGRNTELKKRAISLLTSSVDNASGPAIRTFNKYESKLVEFSKGEDIELKVNSINAITKMIPKLESLSVTPIIPGLLATIYQYLEKLNTAYDDTLIFRIPNVDFTKLSSESAAKISVECLSAIARQANDGTIRHIMKPIWDFLDDQNKWYSKQEFVRSIMRIIVASSIEWSSKGYAIVSTNMQHFDEILDRNQKAGMIRANIFIISIQSKKGATSGARAFEAVAQLVNTLKGNFPFTSNHMITPLQYEDVLRSDVLISSVLECLSVIAQRGKFTQQNISLMESIQQLIKQQETKLTSFEQTRNTQGQIEFEQLSQQAVQHLLLVECLNCVAKVGAYVLSNQPPQSSSTNNGGSGGSNPNTSSVNNDSTIGSSVNGTTGQNNSSGASTSESFYPSHLINALLESSVRPSNSVYVRYKYLTVFLSLLSTKETSTKTNVEDQSNISPNIIETSNKKPTASPAIMEEVDTNSTAIKTRVTISKSQRSKIYFYLYKGVFLNDNLPESYACIARIMRNMLKQHRNKEIENALPMLFKLQEVATATPTEVQSMPSTSVSDSTDEDHNEVPERQQPTMSIRSKLMIHTLIVIYLLCLGELYNSKELEQYIKSIMESRIKQGLLTKHVMTTFEKRHNSGNSLETMKGVISEDEKLKEYTASFASLNSLVEGAANIDKIELVSQDKICELLCKIETLKETYGDVAGVTKIVKKTFTGDSITKTTTVVADDDSVSKPPVDDPWYAQTTEDKSGYDVQVIEGLEVDQIGTKGRNVSRDSLTVSQIQLDLTSNVANGFLTKKREEKNKMLDSILNAVPSSQEDDAQSEDEELEDELQQPKLFLFDSEQFISM